MQRLSTLPTFVTPTMAALAMTVAMIVVPSTGSAQSDTAAARRTLAAEHPWSFATSLGRLDRTSAGQGHGSETRADVFASLARRWTVSGGFGLELEAIGGTSIGSISSPFTLAHDATYERTQRRKYAGLVGSAMYQWRTGQAFRPYVQAGVGTYAVQSAFLLSCNTVDGCVAGPTQWRNAVGLSAGAGFAFRIGGADLFVETALHQMRDNTQWPAMPIGVGVRF